MTNSEIASPLMFDAGDSGFDIIGGLLSQERLDRDSPELWPENCMFESVSQSNRDLSTVTDSSRRERLLGARFEQRADQGAA